MDATVNKLLSQGELAKRWGRSESAISLATAVGTGPRYIKIDGAIKYPFEEVQRYERACMFAEASELGLQTLN
nr:hypothetical protein [uncultured Rhodoferax sp.]